MSKNSDYVPLNSEAINLENERTKIIVTLAKKRYSLEYIGVAVGLQRERIRQIFLFLKANYGNHIIEPDELLWTGPEAARELNTTTHIINAICATGQIPCWRRGAYATGSWVINQYGMEVLRNHPHITCLRTCIVCSHEFVNDCTTVMFCSEECRLQRREQLRERHRYQVPTEDSLIGWRKDLLRRLQSHRILSSETWLRFAEATRYTGLSNMQLSWLRIRNIVSWRPHPTRKSRGRPEATYATSEMEIVKEVLKAHKYREVQSQ